MSTPTLPLPPQHSDWPDAAGARRTGIATGLANQLVRFGAIGVASTLAYLALYVLLRGALGAQPANLLALLATAVANTTANRRLTFGLSGRAAGQRQPETEHEQAFDLRTARTVAGPPRDARRRP